MAARRGPMPRALPAITTIARLFCRTLVRHTSGFTRPVYLHNTSNHQSSEPGLFSEHWSDTYQVPWSSVPGTLKPHYCQCSPVCRALVDIIRSLVHAGETSGP